MPPTQFPLIICLANACMHCVAGHSFVRNRDCSSPSLKPSTQLIGLQITLLDTASAVKLLYWSAIAAILQRISLPTPPHLVPRIMTFSTPLFFPRWRYLSSVRRKLEQRGTPYIIVRDSCQFSKNLETESEIDLNDKASLKSRKLSVFPHNSTLNGGMYGSIYSLLIKHIYRLAFHTFVCPTWLGSASFHREFATFAHVHLLTGAMFLWHTSG